ncbi:glycoside hydrolase family 38 C-terminal domain-containing protein [Microlunatus panaciterrae]|uniref:Alpha-mannosidase n=1 Tax=Microlunatus panaciterrae TaxID=400768 RepID=A0ABS2RMQ8_9ACTN|nr:glycoside hydrolase family 38 C-terminal domain-containing protein [Microlunatus panaciterrae]MBM7800291.1 alpha-mannosidase [Microlunatus panaciterrae]
MHSDRIQIERRLDRILNERLKPAVYPESVPLTVGRWDAPGEPVPVSEGLAAPFKPAAVGDAWGAPWGTTWLELTAEVPADWAGRTLECVIDLGFAGTGPGFAAEGLAYRPDGTVVKGLHPYNTWLPVDAGSTEVHYFVEAASNPQITMRVPTDIGDVQTAPRQPIYTLSRFDLAVVDLEVRELVSDLDVLGQLAAQVDPDQPRGHQIRAAISDALDAIDLHDIAGTAAAARAILAPMLASPAHASAHRLSAVGHAHIDSAWLWPLRETVRKVARTCSNVTQLMDDHPELVFAMSQAQQLAWISEHRPEVFTRVKEKIEAGQFIPVGGMWVESDTNMPGGEAMARQFIHGKRYFLEEFGIDTPEVWLPDTFGYSAALPQLIALSGSRWFLTQKISWNKTNVFPHHTFWWEGIDGTRIFTHFPPVDTYNSDLSGAELALASRQFADKARANHSLVPFGYGDGGGGPTREMIARAQRTADLEGSPRVTIETPASFFQKAEEDYADAPVWWGELYLEIHRGTYTSNAKIKQGNRRSEHLLREAELWSTLATLRHGAEYPYATLDRLWKTVLLHQFHDILPGSSIAWVNREARDTYAAVAAELEQLIAEALAVLAADGDRELVFNANPHARNGVPALGAGPVAVAAAGTLTPADGGFVLDNGVVTATLDVEGLLTSVVDRSSGRDAIAPGEVGNLLQLHQDVPNDWDAWDVDSFYRHTVTDLRTAETVEPADLGDGAVGVRIIRRHGASTFSTVVALRPGSASLDIELDVDWQERETFLKAGFGLDVRAEDSSSETQFGHVKRATHQNTTWEAAKFEICAHRFLHVAEPGFGVALVNDSTYGHDVTRDIRADGGTTTTVRLSLLRSPRWPDPETDLGRHVLRYGIVPGAEIGDAVREGYDINLPERTVTGGATEVDPVVSVDTPDVVVEAVKLAEDQSGDVVVRLYAATGGRATATVRSGFEAASVQSVDLLERPLDIGQSWDDPAAVTIRFRPFQIVTLRYLRG